VPFVLLIKKKKLNQLRSFYEHLSNNKKIVALTALIAVTSVNASEHTGGGKDSGAYLGGWGIFAGWTSHTPVIGVTYGIAHGWEILGKVGYDKGKVDVLKNTVTELALGVKMDVMPINMQSNAYLVGEVIYEYDKLTGVPDLDYIKENLWGVALGLGGEYRFTGKQGFQGFYVDVEVGLKYLSGTEKEKHYVPKPYIHKTDFSSFGTWTAVLAGYRF